MKILFKLWKFPGVSETFILAQIATALKAGYQVKILIKDQPNVLENNIHRRFIEKYDLKNKIVFERLKIPSNKTYRLVKAFWLLIKNVKYLPTIFQFFKHKNFQDLNNIYQFHFYKKFKDFDLIHVQYGTNSKPLDLLNKVGLINSKLVVSFHGHDAFFPINGIIRNEGYYDDLFKYGDLIIANTPYLAKIIKDLGCPENKIKSIPVGVDTSYFYSDKREIGKDGPIKLISVGRLDKIKGHNKAIEVVEILREKGVSVILTIIGEGPERKRIEELILQKELAEVVFLRGRKSQEEVRKALRSHDIYILASIPLENDRQETQGLATLEAQACGLPVIAFDSGGVKYTLLNNITGFVVAEHSIGRMVLKIIELSENPGLYRKMSTEARRFVEKNYSLTMIDEIWCNVYNDLINAK